MMRRTIVGCGAALLLAACTSSHREPKPLASDSETHFLTLCDGRCEDGLTCICGACTRACEDEGACGAFGAAASCEAPRGADRFACGANVPAAVCEAECGADGDCAALGMEHRCEHGVCRAPPLLSTACPARPAPECPAGQHLRAQSDGIGCTTAICELDRACSGPAAVAPMCNLPVSAYSYVAAHDRCELVEWGGCERSANNFETAEACLASCEADNTFDCLEVWEPLARSDDSTLSGIDVVALLDRIEGEHRAQMRYADGSTSPLEMNVQGAIAYSVQRSDNPNPNRSSPGIPLPCRDSLQVEAMVDFETADGRFAERWPRVPFEVLPDGRARARISLKRPGAPSNDFENVTLQGTFEPENLEPNTCDLSLHMDLVIGPSTFSGGIGYQLANAACDDVNDLTAVGQGSPPRPSWLAIDGEGNGCEDDACCALLSTAECSMGARCALLWAGVYDEDRRCVEQRAAGCGAVEMACEDVLRPALDLEDRCWLFPNGCLPRAFTDATSRDRNCADRVQSAPACE